MNKKDSFRFFDHVPFSERACTGVHFWDNTTWVHNTKWVVMFRVLGKNAKQIFHLSDRAGNEDSGQSNLTLALTL